MNKSKLILAKILTQPKTVERLKKKGFIIEEVKGEDRTIYYAYATAEMYRYNRLYELPDRKDGDT